jgi:hypothetical protein
MKIAGAITLGGVVLAGIFGWHVYNRDAEWRPASTYADRAADHVAGIHNNARKALAGADPWSPDDLPGFAIGRALDACVNARGSAPCNTRSRAVTDAHKAACEAHGADVSGATLPATNALPEGVSTVLPDCSRWTLKYGVPIRLNDVPATGMDEHAGGSRAALRGFHAADHALNECRERNTAVGDCRAEKENWLALHAEYANVKEEPEGLIDQLFARVDALVADIFSRKK